MPYVDEVTVPNDATTTIALCIEPWGVVHEIPPGRVLRVVASSAHAGRWTTERDARGFVVYAWEGATYQVFDGGAMIDASPQAVPALPTGASTKDFLDATGLSKLR